MSSGAFAIDRQGDAVIIRLMSRVLRLELVRELRQAVAGLEAFRIIISGTNGYFAAGADINELQSLDGVRALAYARAGQALMNTIAGHGAVTIAAIDGYCMGGGLDLALSCELRYCTPRSVLAHPGGRLGILTGWGGTRRLPRIVGRARALEMLVCGRRLDAAEALAWGLVSRVVDDPVAWALTAPMARPVADYSEFRS